MNEELEIETLKKENAELKATIDRLSNIIAGAAEVQKISNDWIKAMNSKPVKEDTTS
jgi:DNA gyrase/topoisomerase IV subunit A